MIDSTLRLLTCLPLPLLAACSGSEKSASLTDSGAAACEQWTIEQAQLVDKLAAGLASRPDGFSA